MASVSVIMPTYRRVQFLADALESALAQTYPDIEVFVSDNSPDDVVEQVVRGYQDDRIRYRRHAVNVGGAANFLGAVQDAAADVVASLHDDDRWEPTFLERVARPLVEDPSLAIAFCDFDVVDESGRRRGQETSYLTRRRHRVAVPAGRISLRQPRPMAAVLAGWLCQPAYAAAFRRDLVAGRALPPPLDPLYDLWINQLACHDGHDALYVAEVLTHYRTHPGSQTTASPFLDQSVTAYRGYVEDDAFAPARRHLERFLVRLHLHQAAAALRSDDRDAYRDHLGAAAELAPGSQRPALRLLASAGALAPQLRVAHAALGALRVGLAESLSVATALAPRRRGHARTGAAQGPPA